MERGVYLVRVVCLGLVLILGLGAVTIHLFRLQVVRHDELIAKARLKYTTTRTARGTRGDIRDLNGHLLAGNLACRDILVEPWRLGDEREALIAILRDQLDLPEDEVVELRKRFSVACSPKAKFPEIALIEGADPMTVECLKEAFAAAIADESCNPPAVTELEQMVARMVAGETLSPLDQSQFSDCVRRIAGNEWWSPEIRRKLQDAAARCLDETLEKRALWELKSCSYEIVRQSWRTPELAPLLQTRCIEQTRGIEIGVADVRTLRREGRELATKHGGNPVEVDRLISRFYGGVSFPPSTTTGEVRAASVMPTQVTAFFDRRPTNRAGRNVTVSIEHFRTAAARDRLATVVSQALAVPRSDLLRKLDQASANINRPIEIIAQRDVAIEQAEAVAQALRDARKTDKQKPQFKGVRFTDGARRYYPKGALMANVLGFVGANGCGVNGIEAVHDSYLQPTLGQAVWERSRRGTRLRDGDVSEAKPRDGATVYLTIDETVQSIVEEEMLAMVEKFHPKAAYVVMANPATGAIMAMAQYPSFDPNVRSTEAMADGNWKNRILVQGFEPGSIMKPISIAGALQDGVVRLDTTIDCEGGYWVFCGKPLRDSGHTFDDLMVWQVLQKSSNIGTAKIAIAMGEERLFWTLARFGFGQQTGVGLGDESRGIFRQLKNWDGLSISRFPIGQGILTTPLQIVQAYCVLANDGRMMQLRVVDRIEYPDTGEVTVCQPQQRREVISAQTARQVVAAMKRVTRPGGTAPQAGIEGYDVAGKTGTAQKYDQVTKSYDKASPLLYQALCSGEQMTDVTIKYFRINPQGIQGVFTTYFRYANAAFGCEGTSAEYKRRPRQ